jgi:hypothetical protein
MLEEGGTTAAGEAARSSGSRGPAKRQAAQAVRSTTSGDGPADTAARMGRSFSGGASETTPSSTTQARTRRPPRLTRTIVPTPTTPARGSGTE